MKIELKKIQISLAHSEETTCFNADIYVDGKNVGHAKNDGHGGCTDYRANYDENREKFDFNKRMIEAAERYCQSLPDMKFGAEQGMKEFTIKMNLEHFIDNLIEEEIKKKEQKRIQKSIEKKTLTAILSGVPGASSYRIIDFKRPLKDIAKASNGLAVIQKHYNIAKLSLNKRSGEVIFNKNLEELGVIL